jgi:flagellar motor switch protein FliN/FliY
MEETLGSSGALTAIKDEAGAIYDISVEVTAVLGETDMKVAQLLKMGRGAVVQLDRMVGDEIEIYANKQLIALAEVVVVDDHLGISLTKIIKSNLSQLAATL